MSARLTWDQIATFDFDESSGFLPKCRGSRKYGPQWRGTPCLAVEPKWFALNPLAKRLGFEPEFFVNVISSNVRDDVLLLKVCTPKEHERLQDVERDMYRRIMTTMRFGDKASMQRFSHAIGRVFEIGVASDGRIFGQAVFRMPFIGDRDAEDQLRAIKPVRQPVVDAPTTAMDPPIDLALTFTSVRRVGKYLHANCRDWLSEGMPCVRGSLSKPFKGSQQGIYSVAQILGWAHKHRPQLDYKWIKRGVSAGQLEFLARQLEETTR